MAQILTLAGRVLVPRHNATKVKTHARQATGGVMRMSVVIAIERPRFSIIFRGS